MTWETEGTANQEAGRPGGPNTLNSGASLGPPGPVSPWGRKQKYPEGQTPSFPISACLAPGNSPITGSVSPLWGESKGPEAYSQGGPVSSCSESHPPPCTKHRKDRKR